MQTGNIGLRCVEVRTQAANSSDIVLDIEVATDATPEQIETIKTELAKYCPIAKVIRNSGITITENWNTKPL